MELKPSKRHTEIIRIVRDQGTCTIRDLADRLNVSAESIRRDVRPLTESRTLVKVHGAVSLPHFFIEAPFDRRMRENAAEKAAIAKLAAEQIENGDTLMFDTGTTTSLIARELLTHKNLTVVTNSSDIARTLSTVNGNTVYMAGGKLRGDNGGAFGSMAINLITSFRVRHSFISISAIDQATGPMDMTLEEAELAAAVLRQGETSTIVTDQSKFNRSALVKVCDFDVVDRIITDAPPTSDLATYLKQENVEIQIA
ncbi:MAG: DeoR/GlpR family DNA-binding transcription regulator [Rhizobiaceae bacterium]